MSDNELKEVNMEKDSFTFKCPQCNGMIEAKYEYCGHVVSCPLCEKGIVIPKIDIGNKIVTNKLSPTRKKLQVGIIGLSTLCEMSGEQTSSECSTSNRTHDMSWCENNQDSIRCPNCNEELVLPNTIEKHQHLRCSYCNELFILQENIAQHVISEKHVDCGANKNKKELIMADTKSGVKGKIKAWHKKLPTSRKILLIGCIILFLGIAGNRKISNAGNRDIPNGDIVSGFGTNAKYERMKEWYNHQLDYNGLRECNFIDEKHITFLTLYVEGGQSINISICDGFIEYPRSMAKGFAQELINARLFIERYERARDRSK